jgi:hypothetical protein
MLPMWDRAPQSTIDCMLLTGSVQIDAERAFDRAARGRRLSSLIGRLCGRGRQSLPIYHPRRAA